MKLWKLDLLRGGLIKWPNHLEMTVQLFVVAEDEQAARGAARKWADEDENWDDGAAFAEKCGIFSLWTNPQLTSCEEIDPNSYQEPEVICNIWVGF